MSVAIAQRADWRQRLGDWFEKPGPRNFITVLIVINAVVLGLETSPDIRAMAGDWLWMINTFVVTIFVLEVGLKLVALGPSFFRSGWNIFDFSIVAISLVPDSAGLSVLRALRILRVLRLLSTVRHLRFVTESLLKAVPGIGWIVVLMLILFYVFGVMGTELFAEHFPEQFGTVGLSMYSLFQVMTLESWSEAIARPVMAEYPWAWLYFITFILVSSFTVLNLFIGIIVSTMQELHWAAEEEKRHESERRAHDERGQIVELLKTLNTRIEQLEKRL